MCTTYQLIYAIDQTSISSPYSDTLTVLSLASCQLKFDSVQHIFLHCNELIELSIRNGYWCQKSINFLCENLTSKIEKLDMSGQIKFGDEQLKKLMIRYKTLNYLPGPQIAGASLGWVNGCNCTNIFL